MYNTFEKIYEVVKGIPYGKVMTYGQIAKIVGYPKNARIVGYALHANPDSNTIPCHRVVNAKGMISSGYAFGGPNVQRELLELEGIVFDEFGRINLEKYNWGEI